MPFDRDTVEGGIGGAAGERVQVFRRDGRVRQDEGQHRRQVRPDHGGALGEARETYLLAIDGHSPGAHFDAGIRRPDSMRDPVEGLH